MKVWNYTAVMYTTCSGSSHDFQAAVTVTTTQNKYQT